MADSNRFSKGFILYKPKKDGNGSASQWNLGSDKDCVFLEMSNQKDSDDNGNAKFDWDNKICFKLGESDIGEILAVLIGMQDSVGPFDSSKNKHKGLFHSNPKGNSILYFGKYDHGGFRIYLIAKKGEEKTVVQHNISKGEACILNTLLRRAIEVMYRWC